MKSMGDDEIHCRDCGSVIDRERFGGLCPSCLLDDACGNAPPDFAGYELIEEIARGGMGVVYRARQLKPEREVALKCLSGSLIPGDELRALFEVEAAAMARLDHPGVLPVYHFGEADGFPFFTMKLAGGGSLAKRLDLLSGNWRGIALILLEVCDVIRYMHERGMFHRDIKPGNILFDDSGRVFLSDFGIVRLMAADSGEAILRIGTPAYVAPEIIRREDFTALSDLWSLGAVMWEILSGKPPFHGNDHEELLSRINNHQPEPMRPDAPRDLVAVAWKLLEKHPRDRYASAAEVEGELKSWLAGKGVRVRPRSAVRKLASCMNRNPLMATLGVILVVLAIAFVTAQVRNHRNLRESYGIALLHETRSLRAMHRQDEARDHLVRAAEYLKAPHAAELRTEAAAILAFPVWKEIHRIKIRNTDMTGSETFTSDLERFLMAEADGSIGIREVATGNLIESIQTAGDSPIISITTGDGITLFCARHFDGSYGLYGKEANSSKVISKIQSVAAIYSHPDGRRILHLHSGTGAWLGTPAEPFGIKIAEAPLISNRAVIDPTGRKALLLTGNPPRLEVRSLEDGRTLSTIRNEDREPGAAAFSPDGGFIAICSPKAPFGTRILNATTGLPVNEFFDHRSVVSKISWHPSGDSIATVANGENLVWRSISSGGWRLQRPATSRALAFSSDGNRLGYCPADGSLAILDLERGGVFQTYPKTTNEPDLAAYRFDVCPAGKWLAVSESSGVRLWNHETRVQTDHFRFDESFYWGDLKVGRDSQSITGFGLGQGIWKMEINDGKLTDFRFVGEERRWIVADFLTDGTSLLVMEAGKAQNGAWIWPDADPGKARKVSEGFTMVGLRNIPRSGTGYSTHWSEPDVWIWDFSTGKRVRQLGLTEPCSAEPDPSGRWLLVSSQSQTHLFETATWQATSSWPTDAGKHGVFTTAFPGKGSFFAQGKPDGTITLRAIPTGKRILSLLPPSSIRLQQIRFHKNQLIGMSNTGSILIWDLNALHKELGAMNLGW